MMIMNGILISGSIINKINTKKNGEIILKNELKIINHEGKFVTDSRDVALMIGREHKEVLAMIDGQNHSDGRVKHAGFLPTISESGLFTPADFFIESNYKSAGNNKTYKCYLLTKKGCDMVANKMTGSKGILFTATYVTKFEEMENALAQPKLPTTYKEALQSLLIEVEKNEKLELENKELNKEIEYKEDIIINLVDTVSLSEKRQILNRVVRMGGGSKVRERWAELYKQFEYKYHINVNKRLERYNEENKPKLKNKLDYIDKVMGKIPELYEIAVKLYENDIEKLVNEMYELQK